MMFSNKIKILYATIKHTVLEEVNVTLKSVLKYLGERIYLSSSYRKLQRVISASMKFSSA